MWTTHTTQGIKSGSSRLKALYTATIHSSVLTDVTDDERNDVIRKVSLMVSLLT